MKGKGQYHRQIWVKNYLQVLETLKNKRRATAREIRSSLVEKDPDAPVERTIYRVLTKMVEKDKVARKEGPYYFYAPHDILRDRWLDAFDQIFRPLILAGYDLSSILETQAFVITPRNIGFCQANPKSMRKLIEGFELAPPGGIVGLMRADSADIKKGEPVSIVPRDAHKAE